MTIETVSKSAATDNRLAARQWVDAFNDRDDDAEADARTADYIAHAPDSISRMVDGKAAEHWFQMDTLTMFEQLGFRIVPGPRLLPRLITAPLMRLSQRWQR